jgi:hypothetical protein
VRVRNRDANFEPTLREQTYELQEAIACSGPEWRFHVGDAFERDQQAPSFSQILNGL